MIRNKPNSDKLMVPTITLFPPHDFEDGDIAEITIDIQGNIKDLPKGWMLNTRGSC